MNLLSSLRSCISNQCCTNGNFGLDYTNYECKYFAKFKKHYHHHPDHHHFQHHTHHKHHSHLNNLNHNNFNGLSHTNHKYHNQSHIDHKYLNQSHNHIHHNISQHNVSHQNEHHLENRTYPGNQHNNAKNLNATINGFSNNKNIGFPIAEINSHKTPNKEAQKEKITLTLPARSSRSSPSITIITVAAMISIMAQ